MWANAATTMIRPASGVRRIRPSGRCFTATPARAEAARQRRRARRRDHHQSGAGREPASDQSGEAGLKAVDRLDAGQDAGRHAVPDTADRTWQDREDVGLEVCPAWPHGGQPRRPLREPAPSADLRHRSVRDRSQARLAGPLLPAIF